MNRKLSIQTESAVIYLARNRRVAFVAGLGGIEDGVGRALCVGGARGQGLAARVLVARGGVGDCGGAEVAGLGAVNPQAGIARVGAHGVVGSAAVCACREEGQCVCAVSYTHLTLPTIA